MTTMRLLRVWKKAAIPIRFIIPLTEKAIAAERRYWQPFGMEISKSLTALINAGADVNAQSHDGYTALHIAAQNDKLLAIIRALIATGANPNIANNNGNTPLLMAVKAGDIRISRILIDVGSDVNIPYLSGDTALHLAAKNRHLWPLVNPLIAAGADPNIANGGVTPLHLAAERRYPKNG